MVNIIKADLFRILKDRIWIAVIIGLLIGFTIPSLYTLSGMGGSSTFDQGIDLGEYIESRLPDYGVEYTYELTTEQYREIIFSIDGYKTDIDIICGAFMPLYEIIILLEVLLVTRDFSVHSIKNTLSSPVSRKTYYFSKYALILMLSYILILFTNLMIWICNNFINGPDRSVPFGNLLIYTALMLIPLTTFVTIVHAAAFVIRKSLPYSLITIGLTLFADSFYVTFAMMLGDGDSPFIKVIKYFLTVMYSGIICIHEREFPQYISVCIPICVTLTAVALTGGYLFFKNREVK